MKRRTAVRLFKREYKNGASLTVLRFFVTTMDHPFLFITTEPTSPMAPKLIKHVVGDLAEMCARGPSEVPLPPAAPERPNKKKDA